MSGTETGLSQADLNEYLASKNINSLFVQIVEAMLIEKPENPRTFTFQYLQKTYPEDCVPLASAGGAAPAALAAAEAPKVEEPAAVEDSDSEDDEDDYVDEIPIFVPKAGGAGRKRNSVFSESPTSMDASQIVMVDKPAEVKQKILDILNKQVLFKYMDPSQLDTLAGAMEMKKFAADEVIIQEGDPNGDYFYVIESGNVAAIKGETTVFTYEGTGAFGELAIMYNAPRAATCKAVTAVECWALERKAFKTIIMASTIQKREKYVAFLKQVELLSKLTEFEVNTIADAMNEENFTDGSKVFAEGDKGDTFYIVKEGTAVVRKMIGGAEKEVARLESGKFFGEIALLTSKPRQATCIAEGPLTVLSLDRATFTRVMGPLDEILSRSMDEYNEINKKLAS